MTDRLLEEPSFRERKVHWGVLPNRHGESPKRQRCEVPNSKLQAPEKLQDPYSKTGRIGLGFTFVPAYATGTVPFARNLRFLLEIWEWKLLWSLEFGIWSFLLSSSIR